MANLIALCVENQGTFELGGHQYEYLREENGTVTVARIGEDGFPEVLYTVEMIENRPFCSCPDFTFRSGPRGLLCKHGKKCVELGLFEEVPEWVAEQESDEEWLAAQEDIDFGCRQSQWFDDNRDYIEAVLSPEQRNGLVEVSPW